jgi:N-acetylmuramoyl-L-alanine amidase
MKIIQHPLPFWDERPQTIDSLVFHCSTHEPGDMIKILQTQKLSSHYIIGTDGQVFQLVPEEKRAWHAGESFWRGEENLNHRSIGIELSSPTMGQDIYPAKQIQSLECLCKDIMRRYPAIKTQNIVAHSDVAPTRKPDPGISFPWQKMAQKGIGLWYDLADAEKIKETNVAVLLSEIGYDTTDLPAAAYAFCRHFAPQYVARCDDISYLIENVYPKNFVLPSEVLTILQAVVYSYQAN